MAHNGERNHWVEKVQLRFVYPLHTTSTGGYHEVETNQEILPSFS